MVRIYTRTGDDGTTSLIGGDRVYKDSLRIDAYGTVDELNSVLGVVLSIPTPEPVRRVLSRVQDDLFTIGAALATPGREDHEKYNIPTVQDSHIRAMEAEIDRCEEELPLLRKFILPGGTQASALLQLARAVARRAERGCVALARSDWVDPQILRYLNRLSDLCFVLARYVNQGSGIAESHPTFGR